MTASWKRAAVATVALAFASAGFMPLAANATTPEDGNIVDRSDASIAIHKFESGSLIGSTTTADTPDAQGDGLSGVEFKVHKIDANLLTPEGWDKIKAAKNVPADACTDTADANWGQLNGLAADTSFPSKTVMTVAEGKAVVDNLKTGAYLVCEGSGANAKNEAGNSVSVVKKTAPFIVTVPTQHPDGHGWLYNVNVYPKNTVLEAPEKEMEVVENGLGVAKGVKIAITGKVPNLGTGEHLQLFSIVDPLDAALTNPTDYTITVSKSGGSTVLGSDDFVVDYNTGDNMVSANLTRAGLAKLENSNNSNAAIKLEFYATMTTLPQGGGVVNKGYVYTAKGDSVPPTDPGTPVTPPAAPGEDPVEKQGTPKGMKSKNTVKMNWAAVKISKYDAKATNAKLAGAEFKVYVAENQVESTCNAAGTNKNIDGKAISVNVGGQVIDTFKTAQDGTITIPGLFIDKQSVEAPGTPAPNTKRCFVLEEVKAPAGFVLPEADDAKFLVLADSAATAPVEAQIPNTQIPAGDIPALPLTGAFGQVLLTVGGVVLMGGAVAFYLVARRRKEAKA